MKILIVSQYFWPEEFRINEIVLNLVKEGHQVDVLTGKPNYPEGYLFEQFKKNPKDYSSLNGANIYRIPNILRKNSTKFQLFLNYFSFVINGIVLGTFKLRKNQYDIIFTFATSPITVALVSIWLAKIKNAKHIMWVLDIWPNILKELQIIKNKYVINILDKIVRNIYNKTDLILAQSQSFVELIQQKNKNYNVSYFPAWAEDITIKSIKHKIEIDDDKILDNSKFKIVFTGNIGEAQNFDRIIESADLLKSQKDISWIIVGTGRKIDYYKRFIINRGIKNFYFIGKKPINKMSFYHKNADVLLISLKEGTGLSATIPGKIQTYLSSNKCILGFIEGESKKIIEESGVGLCANPVSPEDLIKKIIFLKNNRDFIKKIEVNKIGPNYLNKHFNKDLIFKNLNKFIKKEFLKFDKLKIISGVNKIPMNKNFSLSGLNLAFLGFYGSKKINFHKDLYHWPDGIFFKRFFGNKLRKIPGREIVNNLLLNSNIKKVYVFGILSPNAKKYLISKYNRELQHINLPFDEPVSLYNKYCNFEFSENDLIILTLPTPKQEQFAQEIVNNNKFFKIICVGGAVSMAAGDERAIPIIFEKYGLEFLWRLRTDTKRRIKRLIISLILYLKAELSFKFYNQKKIIIDKDENQ